MRSESSWIMAGVLALTALACASGSDTGAASGDGGAGASDGAVSAADAACAGCSDPSCTNGVRDPGETDVDCGGPLCAACDVGQQCQDDGDCASGVCNPVQGECADGTPSYLRDEDFESGDLARFPWTLAATDGHDWRVVSDPTCRGGTFCARTSDYLASGETARMELALSVREDTEIRFWARVAAEPGEHFFRFLVDGQVEVEVTGADTGWHEYVVPIAATGPGGPDRVLSWELSRSDFVDPDHPPWMQAWIDDIDLPAWNTPPSVPVVVAPWNGKLVTDTTPALRFASFDPDFDPITYEVQIDDSADFDTPVSSGEIFVAQWTPPALADEAIHYWRVRAKDDSDYRWSDWSSPASVEIDTKHTGASVWRQTTTAQFHTGEILNVVAHQDEVRPKYLEYEWYRVDTPMLGGTGLLEHVFTDLPPRIDDPAYFTLYWTCQGDFDEASELVQQVVVDGVAHWPAWQPSDCAAGSTGFSGAIHQAWQPGPTTTLLVQLTSSVDATGCGGTPTACSVRLGYPIAPRRHITSPLVPLSALDGAAHWESVRWRGAGVRLQILDADGALIPDDAVPGNAAGLTAQTTFLWHLDPAQYPAIRLRAHLDTGTWLGEWSITGNGEWRFGFDATGDAEGWLGVPASAQSTTSDGALRLTGTADGPTPVLEYRFPRPVDAARFSELEVRVRTSNNHQDDTVTLAWQNNFGLFDPRRELQQSLFLQSFQDVTFDLTVVPPVPSEPWQGQIEAVRIAPVELFRDAAGAPAAGWFEVDHITLR